MSMHNHITENDVTELFECPFMILLDKAHQTHKKHFDPNEIQASSLVNIQSGGCPEDCQWCAQSAHHKAKIKLYPLMKTQAVIEQARHAKKMGASRICLGAAWRNPTASQLSKVNEMIQAIKALGLETCVTLGQVSQAQAKELKSAGLDYYNHNLETSPEHFAKMTTTRTYQSRLDTINHVQQADLKVCCGGIIGMGESRKDQIQLLTNLANLKPQPKSVPINYLTSVENTPLENLKQQPFDEIEYIKLIAIARILMPKSYIRLSCGRERLSQSGQALAFFAGANSFFVGNELLTVTNANPDDDKQLLAKLDMRYSKAPNQISCRVVDETS